jgi:hypothetical protein
MTEAVRRYPKPIEFQRRHFCFIAEVIAKELWKLDSQARQEVAKAFADCLHSTNGRFKRERFLAACKVSNGQ